MQTPFAHSRPALIGSIVAISSVIIFNVSYWIVYPNMQQSQLATPDIVSTDGKDTSSSVSSDSRLWWAVALIVLAILLGLAAWKLTSIFQDKQRGKRNIQRHADLSALQLGLQSYFASTGHYPVGSNQGQRQIPATDIGIGWEQFGFPSNEEMQKYLADWPLVDPLVSATERNQKNQYLYYPHQNGQSYSLYAHLEPQKGLQPENYSQQDGLPSAWGEYNFKLGSDGHLIQSSIATAEPLVQAADSVEAENSSKV